MKKSKRKSRREYHLANNPKHIVVFDFDDTLVTTDAKIRVTNKQLRLSTSEFAKYKREPEDVMDFSEFYTPNLLNPRPTKFFQTTFHQMIQTDADIMILTARKFVESIKEFLHKYIDEERLQISAHAETPELKKKVIESLLEKYDAIHFYDDSVANIEAIKSLKNPKIKAEIVKN